ncbi:MAG: leucyl aminopeptidase family protein [Sinobacteraceae bacterium]|nr:leucyl aminopeptidase family protein [Nevskiaceae bacterium]
MASQLTSTLGTPTASIADPSQVPAKPLWLVSEHSLDSWLGELPPVASAWVRAHEFRGERGKVLVLPSADGGVLGAALGLGTLPSIASLSPWHVAGLPERLPAGRYEIAQRLTADAERLAVTGWLHGAYRYGRYRASVGQSGRAQLQVPSSAHRALAFFHAEACALARDLINTPAADMGPAELAAVAANLAREAGAQCTVLEGHELLERNYPLIHAVGRTSSRAPRLIDLRWGDPAAPKVTLVGKGVCFDTGGLDLKPSAAMLLMKKDMGGAAVALGVARVLMARQAPIRLRVLIPAVDNSIGGDAFRPSDVLRSRRGLTVEIGNTDAEGRLVLADALCEADSEQPDLLLDFATLTGAARVALGPELPAVFSQDPSLATQLREIGERECDPVWPMPLWDNYDEELGSRVADLNNVASNAFAGAIYGALFLRRFVSPGRNWAHIDLFAWNPRERPGRPVGAEAQCLRLADRLVAARFG